MGKIEYGGHQLEAEARRAFDGNGHELLNCQSCGLRMSRKAADNGFWQKMPCDGKGVGVTMISTAEERVERYTVIEMMPHTWKPRAQAVTEEPQTESEEPQAALPPPPPDSARLVKRVADRTYRATKIIVRHTETPTADQIGLLLEHVKTDEERAAVRAFGAG